MTAGVPWKRQSTRTCIPAFPGAAGGSVCVDFTPHLLNELLTREPISASCDGSTFSTRSRIETFNSFCTGRGTQNVQAWIKSTSSKVLGYPRGFYSLFQTCSFHGEKKKKSRERKKKKVSCHLDDETNSPHLN